MRGHTESTSAQATNNEVSSLTDGGNLILTPRPPWDVDCEQVNSGS